MKRWKRLSINPSISIITYQDKARPWWPRIIFKASLLHNKEMRENIRLVKSIKAL